MKKTNKIIIIVSIILICGICLFLLINKKPKLIQINNNDYQYNNELIDIDILNNKLNNKDSFILFTYNDFCTFTVPCDEIINEGMKELNLKLYSIPFTSYKESKLFNEVKYGPTVIIIKEGKIKYYLDANSDNDLDYYQNTNLFKEWISTKVKLK